MQWPVDYFSNKLFRSLEWQMELNSIVDLPYCWIHLSWFEFSFLNIIEYTYSRAKGVSFFSNYILCSRLFLIHNLALLRVEFKLDNMSISLISFITVNQNLSFVDLKICNLKWSLVLFFYFLFHLFKLVFNFRLIVFYLI